MNKVSDCFRVLRLNGRCALIPFITAGDPDLETTALALKTLADQGADLIELGVPYSDPLADGPVIQAASTRALGRGVTLEGVLEMVEEATPSLKPPLVLFTYYNPILSWGVENFLGRAAQAGVSGLVVPDLPLEEAAPLLQAAQAQGLEVVLLVAPTSSPARIQAIAEQSQGFIYLVSVVGVTGMRTELEQRVPGLIAQIRQVNQKPVAVGFGISSPPQAAQVKAWGADAVVVGSAFVKRLGSGDPAAGLQAIGEFCQSLRQALD